MNPKLSIIVPVYGTEHTIKNCLESILIQSYKNIEVIVVNDGTKDCAIEIAEEIAKEDSRVRIVHNPQNKGLVFSRIHGLKEMTGDYFAFVDSDDSMTIDYYRPMIEIAVEKDADIVIGDYIEMYEDNYRYRHGVLQQKLFDLHNDEILDQLMKQKGMDFGWHVVWNKVYHRHIRDELMEFFDTIEDHIIMCEDVMFSTAFFSRATHLMNVHGSEYYIYNKIGETASKITDAPYTKLKKTLEDISKSFTLSKTLLNKLGLFERYREYVLCWENNIASWWYEPVVSANIPAVQKQVLLDLHSALVSDINDTDSSLEGFFSRDASFLAELPQQNIKLAIADEQCKYVSFDVFDTLVLRPFWDPTDLFEHMSAYVTKIAKSTDLVRFRTLRTEAERIARKNAIETGYNAYGEIGIDDIYDHLKNLNPNLSPVLNTIKAKEVELELHYMRPRKKGLELFRYALAMNKHVIVNSDMYLPSNVIRDLLIKCGYPMDGVSVFVSCETGVNKHVGEMYSYIEKKLDADSSSFVHIGDNYHSDVNSANNKGWHGFYLPKTRDCIMNCVPGYDFGNYLDCFMNKYNGFIGMDAIYRFVGIGTLWEMAANKMYDDPFVPRLSDSDYNGNPYYIGYCTLGPHIFALVDWLFYLCNKYEYKSLNFISRDGYLPMKAMEIAMPYYSDANVDINYVNASRKSIIYMMLREPNGVYEIPENYNIYSATPRSMLELMRYVVDPEQYRLSDQIFKDNDIAFDKYFDSVESFCKFADVFINHFYNLQLADNYYNKLRQYYDPFFSRRSATFDVGYSCRLETTLNRCYGYDVSACYLHTNDSSSINRRKVANAGLHTFYPFKPAITGNVREHLISELGPSCIGFDCSGETAVPIFETVSFGYAETYVTHAIQEGALNFVADFYDIFKEETKDLLLGKHDASMMLEYYLHRSKFRDANVFSAVIFEDDVGAGIENLKSAWDKQRKYLARSEAETIIVKEQFFDYASMSKPKRWLAYLLYDRATLKSIVKYKNQNHPRRLKLYTAIWRALKKIKNIIKK